LYVPLSDVLHQDTAVRRLRRGLQCGSLPHALLFAGPPGVGKEMLAERLAKYILCSGIATPSPGPQLFGETAPVAEVLDDACGRCEDCELFNANNHPDYHRIYRTLNKYHPDREVQRRKALELSIDVVRHFVLDQIALRPSRQRAKIFVITEADRLNLASQNAMLKTLEEPPPQSYLILLTPAPERLLPTIRSRCHRVDFNTLPADFLRTQLAERNRLTPADAAFLAELAQGSLGLALSFATRGVHTHRDTVLSAVLNATRDPLASGKSLLELSKSLAEETDESEGAEESESGALRDAQALVISMAAAVLRDALRIRIGSPPAAIPGDIRLAERARAANTVAMRAALRDVCAAIGQLAQNANGPLVFDAVGIWLGRAFTDTVCHAPC
jgi:DNA polymerase-3 subunit delta'